MVDEERINIISKKPGVSPVELGLYQDCGINQNFDDKVENSYASYIETLNEDNNELTQSILEQLKIKYLRIEQLLLENKQLLQALKDRKKIEK